MKIIRKLAFILIICAISIISVQALEKTLTLEEALVKAKNADISALFAKRDLDNLLNTKEDLIEEADETNTLAGTAETQLKSKVKKYIEPLRVDVNIVLAERNEEQRLVKRDVEITNAYQQVYLAQLAIQKAELDVEIAKKNYEAAKIKLSKGNISRSSLSAAKYSYESKQLSVIDNNNKYKKAVFYLNELLGNDLSTSITVKDEIKLIVPTDWQYNIDSVYETALIASEDIYKISNEAKFADMKLQFAGEEFKPTKDEYIDVLAEKEKADYNLKNAKNSLYTSILIDGNYILTSLENYKLLNLKLDMEHKNMLAMEIKMNKGQVSKIDYLQSKVSELDYRNKLYSVITELNFKYQNFNIKYLWQKN